MINKICELNIFVFIFYLAELKKRYPSYFYVCACLALGTAKVPLPIQMNDVNKRH